MTLWAVELSYKKDFETPLIEAVQSERDRYIAGIYTSLAAAERAASKFLSLSKTDDIYCARATIISEHTLDNGWYEDFFSEEEFWESMETQF